MHSKEDEHSLPDTHTISIADMPHQGHFVLAPENDEEAIKRINEELGALGAEKAYEAGWLEAIEAAVHVCNDHRPDQATVAIKIREAIRALARA